MKILVVAATRAELDGLCTAFNLPDGNFLQTTAFDLLITGVGMTATAFSLGQHLSKSYDLVLNLGIAGGYHKAHSLGTIVNVVTDEFSELGAEDQDDFLSISALGFGESKYQAVYTLKTPQLSALPQVKGITVNKVHGNTDSINKVISRLQPDTESMEGAAVFYCCKQLDIHCLQIRSLSNYVEPRNRETWKIGLAIKTLNDWAIEFLTNV